MSSRAGAGPALGRGASPRGLPGPQRVVVGCPGSWPWQGPQLLAPQPHQHRRHGPWHRRAGRAAGGQLRRPPVPADLRAPVRAGSGAPWCVGRWEGSCTLLEVPGLGFRAGRTARAGNTGQAFTLLLRVQVRPGPRWEGLGGGRWPLQTPGCFPTGEALPADAGGSRGARAAAARGPRRAPAAAASAL